VTYQPDFTGARAKMERGMHYSQVLRDETSYQLRGPGRPEISPSNRIPVRLEYEPETGYHVYRVTAWHSEATIRRWGLMIGDGVHNLRSALDHLVWQLACHNTGGPDLPGVSEPEQRQVQFPIVDSPTPAERANPRTFREVNPRGNPGPLKHVHPEHRAIIYEHQPFGSRFDMSHGTIHPLIMLRRLSNTDKHRTITPIAMLTNRFYIPDVFKEVGGEEIKRQYPWDDQPAEPGAEVLRVKVWPPSIRRTLPNVGYVSPTPSFQDVLPDGVTTYSRSVDIELSNIGFQVDQVIEDFNDLFYRPEHFGRLH
jgi:hypothetical protein